MLVQEIVKFIRLTDGYQLDPDVHGDNAFLLRGVQTYYRKQGLKVSDDLNKMGFELNPQYPGGFMPKGKTNVLSHIQSAYLFFELVMDGTGMDGVRDGACLPLCLVVLCFSDCAFRIMCLT